MSSSVQPPPGFLLSRLSQWVQRLALGRKLAVTLALAAVGFAVITYVALTGSLTALDPGAGTVRVLQLIDIVLALSLGALVAVRLVRLWLERRRGGIGSRLRTNLVGLFSIVAVAPAIVVAVLAAMFFELGVQTWFDDRVRTALHESVEVARAYTEEHQKGIFGDALVIANELNRAESRLLRNPARFRQLVAALAGLRSLAEVVVFQRDGRVLARSRLSFTTPLDIVPDDAYEKTAKGAVVMLPGSGDDRVRALVRLDRIANGYLYVARYIDPQVLDHVSRTKGAVALYERMDRERWEVTFAYAYIFFVAVLLLLLAAVWFALSLATRLIGPVSDLVDAAGKVRDGDLTVRVSEGPQSDEISTLSRAFNRMTGQLSEQRRELVDTNQQLDERRRFTETVLSGVSAGVISLDTEGRITLPNRSATQLLETAAADLNGRLFSQALPEMAELLAETRRQPNRVAQSQISVVRKGNPHTLLVSIAAEGAGADLSGFVVTFDDITELVSAQRTAAWADIARRIAHEIKNPLTPIQLAAERLRRKYGGEVQSDPDIFNQCTETIIRQVGDIGRMIDEFSSFARMPAPAFETENLPDLAQQALFLQQAAHPEINYRSFLDGQSMRLSCDRRQVAQALTNLLQNSADSIEERARRNGTPVAGEIELKLEESAGRIAVEVIDDGIGLPLEQRGRLMEPYVTTRDKGTGLGLAIVRKIMEDHGGQLALEDRSTGGGQGARARLTFYRDGVAEEPPAATPPQPGKVAVHGA